MKALLAPDGQRQVMCREALSDDMPELMRMIHELATHEGDSAEVLTDLPALQRAGCGPSARFGALLAEVDGRLAGFVSFTWGYAIWRDATVMNIDDVYVRPAFRNRGVGLALMYEARRRAREAGASRLRWEAKPWNDGGIRFYERLGAPMRLKGVFHWPTGL